MSNGVSNGGSNVQVKLTWQYTPEQREVSWRRHMWFVEHPGKTYPLELQEDMLKSGVGLLTRIPLVPELPRLRCDFLDVYK